MLPYGRNLAELYNCRLISSFDGNHSYDQPWHRRRHALEPLNRQGRSTSAAPYRARPREYSLKPFFEELVGDALGDEGPEF